MNSALHRAAFGYKMWTEQRVHNCTLSLMFLSYWDNSFYGPNYCSNTVVYPNCAEKVFE